MKLKHANSNNEIVLANKIYSMNLFSGKVWKLSSKINPICYTWKKYFECLQSIIHNFHTTNPNGMNKNFTCIRLKYSPWEMNVWNFDFKVVLVCYCCFLFFQPFGT